MDIVFRPDGNFDEVYLYEELMEADLHAIVRLEFSTSSMAPLHCGSSLPYLGNTRLTSTFPDSLRSAAFRCPLPILPLPDPLRSQVYPLRERSSP
jgi:hypothetical protein